MDPSSTRGNRPEKWQELLEYLDERLQFGLLDRLRKVRSYSFEGDTLNLSFDDPEDVSYLARPAVSQQLAVLAQAAVGVESVACGRPG